MQPTSYQNNCADKRHSVRAKAFTAVALVLFFVPIMFFATDALATVRDAPYSIVAIGDGPSIGEDGSFRLPLEVIPAPGHSVSGLTLQPADGWQDATLTVLNDPAHKSTTIDAMAYEIRATTVNLDQPLRLIFEVDGVTTEEIIDFSKSRPGRAIPVPEGVYEFAPPVPRKSRAQPQPSTLTPAETWFIGDPVAQQVELARREEDKAAGNKDAQYSYDIRVHGRFVYLRADGVLAGADGVTVTIYDDESPFNPYAAGWGLTDEDGYYDITFTHTTEFFDMDPDIYVNFLCASLGTAVGNGDIGGSPYNWNTGVVADYDGTDLDMGTNFPEWANQQGAGNIITVLTRTWRFMSALGYFPPPVDVIWPINGGSYYGDFPTRKIHLSTGDGNGNEGTIIHEYGHHWMYNFSNSPSPSYCNSTCDEPDCGHCLWCAENAVITWTEGFPDFMGHWIPRTFTAEYGQAALAPYGLEWIQTCGMFGPIDDPMTTEGMFGALLVDMVDDNADNDLAFDATVTETANIGANHLFTIASVYDPGDVTSFLSELVTYVSNWPAFGETELTEMWEAGLNNGYELDSAPPGTVSNLHSPTHTISVPSPANYIHFSWDRATDDVSGIAGYSVSVTANNPTIPDTIMDVGDLTYYEYPYVLSAQTVWFSIRTVDRSGKWGDTVSAGPYIIGPPTAADLEPEAPEFWDSPVVPRSYADATTTTALAPTLLQGGVQNTYLNFAFENNTVSTVSASDFFSGVCVDGVTQGTSIFGGQIVAGEEFSMLNKGPYNVLGGRHVISGRADVDQLVSESLEDNNNFGRQWMWKPQTIAPYTTFIRPAPPNRTGGWSDVIDSGGGGATLTANTSAFRYPAVGYWNVISIWPVTTGIDADFDLELHPWSNDPVDGHLSPVASSMRGPGLIDALIVNNNTTGTQTWDLALLNANETTSPYYLIAVESELISYTSDLVVTIPANEVIAVREIYVPSSSVGPFNARIQIDPADGPVTMLWFDDSFGTGGLSDYTVRVVTDEAGVATVAGSVTDGGYHCIVLYREADEGAAKKTNKALTAVDVELTTGAWPADFEPTSWMPGWHSPLVPSPVPASPLSVPAPAELPGDSLGTHINFVVSNTGQAEVPTMSTTTYADGVLKIAYGFFDFPSQTVWPRNDPFPVWMPGGRHTMSMQIDFLEQANESDETNNTYGEQWVWRPAVLPIGSAVVRTAPPNVIGGFSDITFSAVADSNGGEGGSVTVTPEVFLNCDGVRTPVFAAAGDDGYWGGVAVMSGTASNVNMQLHEISTGAQDGFSTALTASSWAAAQLDFTLVNFNGTAFRDFDVGIVLADEGQQDYRVQTVSSVYLGTHPLGSYGTFTLDQHDMLNLHEVYLSPGPILIEMTAIEPGVDYGISLYGPLTEAGMPYFSRNDIVSTTASSWFDTTTDDERIIVDIVQTGHYCLAVWKADAYSEDLDGAYDLLFAPVSSGVDNPTPIRSTNLLASVPNPFNPRTVVHFELARPLDVKVDVYDMRGAHMRTLVRGSLPAGRQQIEWDGTNDSGHRLTSGTYFVRLSTIEGQQIRKVSLVK